MRLKKITIGKNTLDGYKNLQNCTIEFEERDGLTILIGNNGSGKSNLLEAISFIFHKLFLKQLTSIDFKFLIEYEINGKSIRIHNQRSTLKFSINNDDLNEQGFYSDDTNFPDKVFTLYSGEELRLWENVYYEPYTTYYHDVINNRVAIDALQMNYINKYYWNIAVLLLFIKDANKIARILNNSNIENIKFDINTQNLLNYSNSNPNKVTIAVNAIMTHLNTENKITFENFNQISYIDEYGDSNNLTDITLDLYYILLVAILPKDNNYKTINKFDIEFDNGLNISDFSEGQKKEILVIFITDVLASVDSLFLLDEPDSHIHPVKKKNLIKILKQSDTKNIIMTTHSPTLIREVDNRHFVLMQDGEAKNAESLEILKEITDNKWSIDSINNVLIANKDIILVEGKTDIEYIETALSKLREYPRYNKRYENLDFTLLPFGGASGLSNFINKFNGSDNQKVIALLDRDQAGKDSFVNIFDDYSSIDNFTSDDFNQIYIHTPSKIKVFFLPNKEDKKTFEIEDYFGIEKLKKLGRKLYKDKTESITQLKQFIDIKTQIKNELPNECQSFNKEDFKDFKQLFDKLKEAIETP